MQSEILTRDTYWKMTNLKELTLEQLEELRLDILTRNAYWKSSQDGSYELALHAAGFDAVVEEIRRRKQNDD